MLHSNSILFCHLVDAGASHAVPSIIKWISDVLLYHWSLWSKCHTLSLATKLAMAEPKYTPVQLEMNVSRRVWEIGDHWVSVILCMLQYTWKARRPEL